MLMVMAALYIPWPSAESVACACGGCICADGDRRTTGIARQDWYECVCLAPGRTMAPPMPYLAMFLLILLAGLLATCFF
jgi:hypothetical protein